MDTDDRRRAAVRGSIEALAHGDAFGERFFGLFRPAEEARALIAARRLPPEPHWHWTDDTAMRVAPLGAWFHHDLDRAAAQAARSAEVTHAHPQGVAGAVAVAVAAALAARGAPPALAEIAVRTPDGPVRQGLLRAADLPSGTGPEEAAAALGSGRRIRADDTVPFALWCAARHPDDLPAALWTAAAGLGDVDTTCAITGGVVGARTGTAALGQEWTRRREPLPDWADAL